MAAFIHAGIFAHDEALVSGFGSAVAIAKKPTKAKA